MFLQEGNGCWSASSWQISEHKHRQMYVASHNITCFTLGVIFVGRPPLWRVMNFFHDMSDWLMKSTLFRNGSLTFASLDKSFLWSSQKCCHHIRPAVLSFDYPILGCGKLEPQLSYIGQEVASGQNAQVTHTGMQSSTLTFTTTRSVPLIEILSNFTPELTAIIGHIYTEI